MDLILALAIVCFFLALIGWGRYAEFSFRKRVARAVRRKRCPKCGKKLDGARVSAVRQRRRGKTVAAPRQPFPQSWRVQCRHCSGSLYCDSSCGGIRFQ